MVQGSNPPAVWWFGSFPAWCLGFVSGFEFRISGFRSLDGGSSKVHPTCGRDYFGVLGAAEPQLSKKAGAPFNRVPAFITQHPNRVTKRSLLHRSVEPERLVRNARIAEFNVPFGVGSAGAQQPPLHHVRGRFNPIGLAVVAHELHPRGAIRIQAGLEAHLEHLAPLRALAHAARVVDGLYFSTGERSAVVTGFVNQTIEELPHITATVRRWVVGPANVEGAARVHRRSPRRALRVQDPVDIQTERGSVPGPGQMAKLPNRYFAGACGLIESEMAGSEGEGQAHSRAAGAGHQLAVAKALAKDEILIDGIAHLSQRLDPGFDRVVGSHQTRSVWNLDALIAAIKAESLAHHSWSEGDPI